MITQTDASVLLWIQNNLRCAFLSPIFVTLSRLGDAGFLFILTGLVLLCFKKTRSCGLLLLISLILGFTVNDLIIKRIVERVRPFNSVAEILPLVTPPKSFSFPSGHSASAFACAVSLYYTKRKWFVFGLITAALIAFSRLYVGVHYPTDVLCGALVGTITAVIAGNIYTRKYKTRAAVK